MSLLHLADTSLFVALSALQDPRSTRNQLYPLIDILAVVILGIFCNENDFVSCYHWAVHHHSWLQSKGLCLKGIPSHDTLNRVFRLIDPIAFNNCFMTWVHAISQKVKGVIAIDGKTLCNSGDESQNISPLHLVHAFAAEHQLLLGQVATEEKSNEITAIPELLNLLDIKGNIITIDAIGCQTKIVSKIRYNKGDYVIALKANQGTLYAEVQNFFKQALHVEPSEAGCDFIDSLEKNRARVEERKVWACLANWLPPELTKDWVDLKSLVCVQSTRTYKGKTTQETRYFITSLAPNAENLAKIVRSHWAIENLLHWSLDVWFAEDASTIRKGHAATNFSLAKKAVLNVLKTDTNKKVGVSGKRKRAAWDPEYLCDVL